MGSSSSKINKIYNNQDIEEVRVKNVVSNYMSETITNKLSDSIVRIEIGNKISTGFFMKINLQNKMRNFLMTCAHSIPQEDIDSKKTILFYYGKAKEEKKQVIELDCNKRFLKCFKKFDIEATLIEVLEKDKIPEEKYLYPDLNYVNGYDHYYNLEIYTAGYPEVDKYKNDKHFSTGKTKKNEQDIKIFYHTCAKEHGSSGSPLLNAEQLVIGIHFGSNFQKTVNKGVFIGVIIDHLISEENNIHFKNETNILSINDKNRNNEKIIKDSAKNKNLGNSNKNKDIKE